MLAIWFLVPLPLLKIAWTSGSSWFMYCWSLGLENFEDYFTSMWDECNFVVVWAFFGMLEWIAIPSFRGSFQSRDWSWIPCLEGRFFTIWATRESEMWKVKVKVAQSCLTLCDPGIPQARIFIEWVCVPFCRESSGPRIQTRLSYITGRFFTNWAIREAHFKWNERLSH